MTTKNAPIFCGLAIVTDDAKTTKSAPPVVNTKMTIRLKHDNPTKAAPYRLSVADNQIMKTVVDDLLKKGHIRPSTSPYAATAILTPGKKKGEHRILVNYMPLNNATVREDHPPRDIDDYRRRLACNRLYSRYRVRRDFHLVKMAEDSIKYTSFVTPFGQYEFLVMPYGLMNNSCFFLKFLHEIFDPLIKSRKIILHLEDILIATHTQDQHLDVMDAMNEVVDRHQLTFKDKKCYGMEDEMNFMGFRIDKHGAHYGAPIVSSSDEDDDLFG